MDEIAQHTRQPSHAVWLGRVPGHRLQRRDAVGMGAVIDEHEPRPEDEDTDPGLHGRFAPSRSESMNRDEIEGEAEPINGSADQAVADDDERLRERGEADDVVGQVRSAGGRARRKVAGRAAEAGKDLKR
jgi:uncharacterized protein YjbJ (UPF0337 family)